MKAEWQEFWGQLAAEAVKLGQSIYDQVKGDPEEGLRIMKRMRLDYDRRRKGEATIDDEIAKERVDRANRAVDLLVGQGAPLSEARELVGRADDDEIAAILASRGGVHTDRPLEPSDLADAQKATKK